MIVKEFYITREDGVNLFRSYSNRGMMIQKIGTDELYSEAIDIEGAPYQYEETDEPIPPMPDDLLGMTTDEGV